MAPAAPSRQSPTSATDIEASAVLKLGDFADIPCLNISEARIILQKTLDTRKQKGAVMRETETLNKTRIYLEIFSVFKEIPDAQALEGIVNVYSKELTNFEKSAIGMFHVSFFRGKKGWVEVADAFPFCRQLGAELCG
jgi:DNA-directed RNA polymerase II subunit RPB4